jgi:hypothetical protein
LRRSFDIAPETPDGFVDALDLGVLAETGSRAYNNSKWFSVRDYILFCPKQFNPSLSLPYKSE